MDSAGPRAVAVQGWPTPPPPAPAKALWREPLVVAKALLPCGARCRSETNERGGNDEKNRTAHGLADGAGSAGERRRSPGREPAKGEEVFNKCKICHVLDEPTNRMGPYLVGIIGRQAGTAEGFKYSDAMKESGVVWNDETLAAYLADPRAYIPGNRMFFPGLKQEEEIRDLLA